MALAMKLPTSSVIAIDANFESTPHWTLPNRQNAYFVRSARSVRQSKKIALSMDLLVRHLIAVLKMALKGNGAAFSLMKFSPPLVDNKTWSSTARIAKPTC